MPDQIENGYWQNLLAGGDREFNRVRRRFGRMPSPPRCKLCGAPFGGWGWLFGRFAGRRPSIQNAMICGACYKLLEQHPGGTEIELSVLTAEIRQPTKGQEGRSPELVQRFRGLATFAVDEHEGLVNSFNDHCVSALFLPLFAGESHAQRAIDATRDLFAAAIEEKLAEEGVEIGVGLNTGRAFVGCVRNGDRLDFTALGDTVGVAGKLGAAASAGEALIAKASWGPNGGPVAKSRQRTVPIPGRLQPVEAVVMRGHIEAHL